MSFQLSPGLVVNEIDNSTVVVGVSSTEAAIAGVFPWGPVEDAELVTNEDELHTRYGKPTNTNYETFFTAASFLSYGNSLFVSRAADANSRNSVAPVTVGSPATAALIKNAYDFTSAQPTLNSAGAFFAKYPGQYGNSLKISVANSTEGFSSVIASSNTDVTLSITSSVGSNQIVVSAAHSTGNLEVSNTTINDIIADLTIGDFVEVGNTEIGIQTLKLSSIGTATANATHSQVILTANSKFRLSSNVSMATTRRLWEYASLFNSAPGTSDYVAARSGGGDEMHVVVVDAGGIFTGRPGTVLETFADLSRATDAKNEQNVSTYYKNVLNNSSKFIWANADLTGAVSGSASALTALSTKVYTASFTGGVDSAGEDAVSIGSLAKAWDVFKDAEELDISLLLVGKSIGGERGEAIANYVIDNIATVRKDCIALVSPQRQDVVDAPYQEVENVIAFRNALSSTSYAVLDSGYKQMYDRYNDVFRWVPLNGDVGGLIVRTDFTNDPWWSPAGFNRGQIKNVIRLAYNPNKAQRDQLYKNSINPVVTFKNEGTILYGDKTLQNKTSAFDRINVRRLFIVLEKSIARAGKYTLFEFNDAFTRAQFRNLIEPFLRDVQGRRGIYQYRVVCDETNNTPQVIDTNNFVGDIYIQPARSINFITLNFIAERTDGTVRFTEVGA